MSGGCDVAAADTGGGRGQGPRDELSKPRQKTNPGWVACRQRCFPLWCGTGFRPYRLTGSLPCFRVCFRVCFRPCRGLVWKRRAGRQGVRRAVVPGVRWAVVAGVVCRARGHCQVQIQPGVQSKLQSQTQVGQGAFVLCDLRIALRSFCRRRVSRRGGVCLSVVRFQGQCPAAWVRNRVGRSPTSPDVPAESRSNPHFTQTGEGSDAAADDPEAPGTPSKSEPVWPPWNSWTSGTSWLCLHFGQATITMAPRCFVNRGHRGMVGSA